MVSPRKQHRATDHRPHDAPVVQQVQEVVGAELQEVLALVRAPEEVRMETLKGDMYGRGKPDPLFARMRNHLPRPLRCRHAPAYFPLHTLHQM